MEIQQQNSIFDDKLINLIKENFSEEDNELFKLSYQLYVSSYNNQNDFIISLDDIYKWIGFAKKGNAKTLLLKHFENNVDYIVQNILRSQKVLASSQSSRGPLPEKILLTIDCFKTFCLISANSKSKQIYNYYIKMEKIIFNYIQNQLIEHSNKTIQLEDQTKQLEDQTKQYQLQLKQKDETILALQKQLPSHNSYEEIKPIHYVYVCSTDIHNIYKIGFSKSDPTKRVKSLQTSCVEDIVVEHVTMTSNGPLLESIIHYILDRYRCNSKREHFSTSLSYIKKIISISNLFMDTLKSSYDNISDKDLLKIILLKLNTEFKISELTDITTTTIIDNNTANNITNSNTTTNNTQNTNDDLKCKKCSRQFKYKQNKLNHEEKCSK